MRLRDFESKAAAHVEIPNRGRDLIWWRGNQTRDLMSIELNEVHVLRRQHTKTS